MQLCSYHTAGFVVKGTDPVTLQKLVVYVVVDMSATVLLACLVLRLLAAGVAHLSGLFEQSTPSPGTGSAWPRRASVMKVMKNVMKILLGSVALAWMWTDGF